MDTDTALANRLARDVDAAFPDLVTAHQDRLYTIALRLLGDRRDAEEVAQDALVRAFRAMHGYPRERIAGLRLRPWLASITVNLARNRRRRLDDRQPPNQLEPMLDAGFDPATDDRRAAPALTADRRETQRELAVALLRLAPGVRAAIVLRHVDGLSVAEVAEALDRPEGTIKAQVHRGLKELRLLLEAPMDAVGASVPATDHRSIARAASPLPAMEAIR
jgi:RNA polymerase sigma-70 factor (ECF subfamily)